MEEKYLSYENIIEQIEKYFEQRQPKKAEAFIWEVISEAQRLSNRGLELQMLNELIGYYRQTSEQEKLREVITNALTVAMDPALSNLPGGELSFATTALNAATGYRSIGELENSHLLYQKVLEIYAACLEPMDLLYAGLYNNLSLLEQEMGNYEASISWLKKALAIVTYLEAGFEIAVTYANLANSAVQQAAKARQKQAGDAANSEVQHAIEERENHAVDAANSAVQQAAKARQKQEGESDFDTAREYALEAIRRFEERGTIDPHYCAALSALAMCYYYEEDYAKAKDIFQRAMNIIEQSFGRNSQYERCLENRRKCEMHLQQYTGQELSRLFFEAYGQEQLKDLFPEDYENMTIGLVGSGSDCLGYDDQTSYDHDQGPDFCIWLTEEQDARIGEKVREFYRSLPTQYKGYQRKTTQRALGRRGVRSAKEFYEKHLGTAEYEKIPWGLVPDYSLLNAANGVLFKTGNAEFDSMRQKLQMGFPQPIQYLKLAEDMGRFSQTGQYNFGRMLRRGDRITADQMLLESLRHLYKMVHHMENQFAPHDKWLYRSFLNLAQGTELPAYVTKLHSTLKLSDEEALSEVERLMEELGSYLAQELYRRNFISDITSYLDYHTPELQKKAEYAELSVDELVEKVARVEFAAFDQVQNEGGRASCQNNWPTFSIMRKSQYLTWNRSMLLQYLYDFERELELGHNLITEKYGRMMESTAPEKYEAIKEHFPVLSDEKKAVIEQIVALQMNMLEEFGKDYPGLAGNARSFHTYEDNYTNTSYETYLRGEISTYSDKMLQLYGAYVVTMLQEGKNIARLTIENTARLYGYDSLEEFEKTC